MAAGEPAAILISSEAPIYGRFGYGLHWDIVLGVIPRRWNEDAAKRFHMVAEAGGDPVGCDLFAATTLDAYVALWDHLLRLDWVTRMEAGDRPEDEPLRLLVNDARHVRVKDLSDFLWTWLLEVVDRFRPASGGRFALDGGPTGSSCRPTDEPPDLVVDTADLAAAWLGGAPLWPPPFCNTWF